MKAVVLQIKDKKAAVLTQNSEFKIINNQNYSVGQCVVLKQRTQVIAIAFKAACAAAAVLLCSLGAYAYATPYSYVSLDINPSIEYVLNRFDRVLDINAVNCDGDEIVYRLEQLGIKNRSIAIAVDMTVNELCQSEYISRQEENVIVVAAASANKTKCEQLAQRLQNSDVNKDGDVSSIKICSMSISNEQFKEAKRLGVSPGKLKIVAELEAQQSENSGFSKEEWLKKPMKEVVNQLESNRQQRCGNDATSAENTENSNKAFDAASENDSRPSQHKYGAAKQEGRYEPEKKSNTGGESHSPLQPHRRAFS